MKSSRPLLVGAAAAAAIGVAGLLAAAPATATTHHDRAEPPVFVQTDDPAGNTVVAYDRTATGQLVSAGSYATGGLGGVLAGSVVDHTASEGAMAYDRTTNTLYVVNAGSNTITSFTVHGTTLSNRQVVASGGQFPVSITTRGPLVYVLNARAGGSVQGFARFGHHLVRVPAWHRNLGLDPTKTPEFANTPGQVAFTPSGHQLVVTTKNGSNSLDVFAVGRFGLSDEPVQTALPAGTVPFGVAFGPAGQLAVSEAGPNAVASFAIAADGTLSPIQTLATGQVATCWLVASGDRLYASNTGSATETGLRISPTGALTSIGVTHSDAAPVDAAASSDGRFLYVQAGAAGIVDEFAIEPGGALSPIGSVTVPNAAGAEGIVAL